MLYSSPATSRQAAPAPFEAAADLQAVETAEIALVPRPDRFTGVSIVLPQLPVVQSKPITEPYLDQVLHEVGSGLLDAFAGARATVRERTVSVGAVIAAVAALGICSFSVTGGALIVIGGHGYGAFKFLKGLCEDRPGMNKLAYSAANFVIALGFVSAAVVGLRDLAGLINRSLERTK